FRTKQSRPIRLTAKQQTPKGTTAPQLHFEIVPNWHYIPSKPERRSRPTAHTCTAGGQHYGKRTRQTRQYHQTPARPERAETTKPSTRPCESLRDESGGA